MTGDGSAPDKGDRSFSPDEGLNRALIEEFYKDSVEQYGIDSVQARMLLKLLSDKPTKP